MLTFVWVFSNKSLAVPYSNDVFSCEFQRIEIGEIGLYVLCYWIWSESFDEKKNKSIVINIYVFFFITVRCFFLSLNTHIFQSKYFLYTLFTPKRLNDLQTDIFVFFARY